jgi:hypothetical protein
MTAATGLRTVGVVAVLAGGALHLRLALDGYGNDDLITLFFLNAIGSALVAAWMTYDRRPLPLLAGLGVSAVSLLAFGLSRVGDGVVGFRGVGLEPAPDVLLTLGAEAVAVVALAIAVVRVRGELVRSLRPTAA